jgi:hypothetical protein
LYLARVGFQASISPLFWLPINLDFSVNIAETIDSKQRKKPNSPPDKLEAKT